MRKVLLSQTTKQTTKTLNKIQARILNVSLATIIGLSSLFSAVPFLFPASAAAATLSVCSSGCTYTSIQAAITAASPSDTITVGAGTYTEQIVIDKNLTLTGVGSGTTIIQAPASLVNDPDGAKTIVLVTGSITAEISGFTIQGPVNGLNFGIYVRDGATANIHNNTVKDIRDEPLSGGQSGYAIEVGKYNNTFPNVDQVGHATVTNNLIFGYQKTGIEVEGAGSSGTITGNTVTGAGATAVNAQNGIQIRRGATGSISNNIVTGNTYINPGSCNPSVSYVDCYSAIGISVTYPGNDVIVQGNTANHNTANIYTYEAYGVQILNNQVADSTTGLTSAGITADSDNAATGSAGITGVTISGNTIKNNLSGGSHQGDGILLWGIKNSTISNNIIEGSGYDGIMVGASGNISFTGNTFSNNGLLTSDTNAAGIDFGGVYHTFPYFGLQPNTLGGFTVHNNSFSGNRKAIWNYDTGNVDATSNYWGSANPSFSSLISGTNTHTPWYTDSARTIPSTAADLTSLSLSAGTLSPSFSSATTSYSATVANSVTSVSVTDTASTGAGVAINGGSNLAVGANTVTVTVTSADSTASKTYTITVNRAAAAQTLPDSGGNATVNNTTPQVVVTSTSQPLTITVSSGTTNATIDYSSLKTSSTTAVVPQTIINTQNANVQIQGGTTITSSSSSWNGVITAPTVKTNTSITIPTPAGQAPIIGTVIEVGAGDIGLTFDKAARLLIPGQAGTLVGFIRSGVFTQINTLCSADSQDAGNALPAGGDCYINVGSDMVIWTKHFTQFATYTKSNTYVVQSGDTMFSIATKFGLTLAKLEALNPQAGHPAGNFSLILPGDVLNVGGAVVVASSLTFAAATTSNPTISESAAPQQVLGDTSSQRLTSSANTETPSVASTVSAKNKMQWYWYAAIATVILIVGGIYYAYRMSDTDKK